MAIKFQGLQNLTGLEKPENIQICQTFIEPMFDSLSVTKLLLSMNYDTVGLLPHSLHSASNILVHAA